MNFALKITVTACLLITAVSASELTDIIEPGTEVEKLADGFGFGEGPAWHPGDQALYFSDLKNKTIHRWSRKEGVSLVRQGKETFANGIVIDSEGRLVFCETGHCRIVRREADGTETVLADQVDGQPLGMTNDLWMAPDGGIYFTVPNKKIPRLIKEGRLLGAIIHLAPDGTTRNVGTAVNVKAPNGIVGSSDGKRLYFRDGGTCRMAKIQPDGSLTDPVQIADKGTDGLTLDELGNLYTTSKQGVDIYTSAGKHVGLIPVPEPVANLTFGDSDLRTLYITARTGLYAVKLKVKGDSIVSSPAFNTIKSSHKPLIDTIETFFDSHCYQCHDADSEKGDLDLTELSFNPEDPTNFKRWEKIFDKVKTGEMPPPEQDRPSQADQHAFLNGLEAPLHDISQQETAKGRSIVRRLNRSEFETTLSDLFEIPLNIQNEMPEDAKQDGFDTVGAALNVSSIQMESYLDVLDKVLDKATVLFEKPEPRKWRLSYKETSGMMQEYRRSNAFNIEPDGVAFLGFEYHSYLNSVLDHFTIPYDARYRVKVSAYALRSDDPLIFTIRTGGPGHNERDEIPKTLLGHVSVKPGKAQVFEFDQHLQRGQFFRMYPATLPIIRFDSPKLWGTQKDYQGPGVVVQWVEVEGPFFDQWPPASHQRLWSGIKLEANPEARPNNNPNEHLDHPPTKIAQPRMRRPRPGEQRDGNRLIYDPEMGIGGEAIYRRASIPRDLNRTLRLVPKDPKKDASRLLNQFIKTASRVPINENTTRRYISLVHRWLDEGDDFETAMRAGYKAILTSPGFLYHQSTLPNESPELDDHTLASRLAYFLWNSAPDDELRKLAAEGKLSDPSILHTQVDRMISDSRSHRFLTNFLGQWLDLRLLDFTTPDSALFPEHDAVLQWSLEAETLAFFRELLDHDLSVTNVIDSDFAMLNRRLADHYGIDEVEGMNLRRVQLPEDSVRGGVLTQGSVLKVTANGTNTSPVVRGVWVLERIMGHHPDPPPPGIPAVEPDIRGAVTIRQQIDKHRESKSCASCHIRIDPPGIALENFDVIGAWRDSYRVLNPKKVNLRTFGSAGMKIPIKYTMGLPVDAADQLADGSAFEDIREFKSLLLKDPNQIARTVTEKLVIYATGAPVEFGDRREIERIIKQTEPNDHGFRSLIHALVQSPLFQNK